jgi:hypothetical protein
MCELQNCTCLAEALAITYSAIKHCQKLLIQLMLSASMTSLRNAMSYALCNTVRWSNTCNDLPGVMRV